MSDKRYAYEEYRRKFLPSTQVETVELTPYDQGVEAANESLRKFGHLLENAE